ncbi:hypothetical protein KM043_006048 [Ampulex compressa]|nr:hypothetical protein KM043_006048 [Ampulex compressa]
MPSTDSRVYCNVSMSNATPYVTELSRDEIFNKMHGFSHSKIRVTQKLIREQFIRSSINTDCREWTQSCVPCQRSKVTRHVTTPLEKYSLLQELFEHLRVDLVSPLQVSHGHRYCLISTDRFTHSPQVIPMEEITAEATANASLGSWIARFEIPLKITTD